MAAPAPNTASHQADLESPKRRHAATRNEIARTTKGTASFNPNATLPPSPWPGAAHLKTTDRISSETARSAKPTMATNADTNSTNCD